MSVHLKNDEYAGDHLATSIQDILDSNPLCAIATVNDSNCSHIHTAYFAFDSSYHLFFLSDPDTRHCRNLAKNPTVAVAIYDSRQPWEQSKRGLQLFGSCLEAAGRLKVQAHLKYVARFVGYGSWFHALSAAERKAFRSRFYAIRVDSLTLFDEVTFGEEVFVPVVIERS
jgi:uncharacterized protein YhbP (UPF0306 family)